MTKEEAIIQDWIATLQTINPLNEYAAGKNYLTDIGDNVEYWLTIPEPDEEIKQLVIEDRICEGEEISDPTAAHYQVLELINTVYYPDGADTATRQGEAKADIIRCIGANWQNFLNKYKDVVIKNISTEKIEQLVGEYLYTQKLPQGQEIVDLLPEVPKKRKEI